MNFFRRFWKGFNILKPGESVHSDKWDRCVEHVKSKNPAANAYAVCTAVMGSESFKSADDQGLLKAVDEEMAKMGIEAADPVPESLLADQDLEGRTRRIKGEIESLSRKIQLTQGLEHPERDRMKGRLEDLQLELQRSVQQERK